MNKIRLKAIGVRDISDKLTTGKEYEALFGIEEGIFLDRPYVTVIGDNGKQYSCHASRFKIIEEKDNES